MNLFTVELKNQPGELAHLGDVCAQRGVNLQLAGVVTGDRGTVLFTASDEPAVRTALEGAGIGFTERPALQVTCADQPGEAARIGHTLANAGVNIEGLLEVSICQGEIVFRSPSTSSTTQERHSAIRSSDDPIAPARCVAPLTAPRTVSGPFRRGTRKYR
jgi:hypothetical protein